MNRFRVWMVSCSTDGLASWQDNPAEAIARVPISPVVLRHEAEQIALGFNERELRCPIGAWALVCREDQEPAPGQLIKVKSIREVSHAVNQS